MITENGGPEASTEHPLQGGNQLQNGPTETIDASESRNSGNPSTSSAEPHRSRSGKPYSIKRKLDAVKPVLSRHRIKRIPSIKRAVAEVPKFISLIYFK